MKTKQKILPIIFGIKSTSLSTEEIEFFQSYPIQGIILFSRNIESKEQLIALNKSIKDLYQDRSIPIFVDQEGGRVARIKPPIAKQLYPAAKHFADLYKTNKDEAIIATYENYKQLMSEAKELGFDSICAPVCDLLFDGASNVIGDRSFSKDPIQVIDLAGAAIDAILETGGIPFIKHLPGHGRALVDSHYELPFVDASLSELIETDFKPFKNLQKKEFRGIKTSSQGIEIWGMTAHIVYKEIDPDTPLTMSAKGIQYVRENIFNGIIVSDDIGMLALHGRVGVKKALLKLLIDNYNKQPNSQLNKQHNEEWLAKYHQKQGKKFEAEFNQSPNSMSFEDLIQFAQQKESEIAREFLQSLANAGKLSIESGCDYILHCSGEINEMRAIVAAF